MKRKDLKKRLDLKAYDHLPQEQRKWLMETAFIQDFNRNMRSMVSPMEGGACVMRHVRHTDRHDAITGMYRGHPLSDGLARPVSQYITGALSSVHDIRQGRKHREKSDISTKATEARIAAISAARGAQGTSSPDRARPDIGCRVNRTPSVVSTDKGGVANVSINWIRSVKKEGIGVLDWNANDKVLVVSARHNPSFFLAEMGVKCFEVVGMRLGIKAYKVEGYAFTTVINDKRHSIFSQEFRRGVTTIENLIAEAFSAAMKVQ